MSRGGGNPNWEWQLISQLGHTNDMGLRQRALVAGVKIKTYNQLRKHDFEKRQKRKAAKPFDLASIFKPKVEAK